MAPTLSDIRATRLLANRMKFFLPQDALEAEIVRIPWGFNLDPVWMSPRHGFKQFKRFKTFKVSMACFVGGAHFAGPNTERL